MLAARFYQPGDVRYEACPTPDPGPGELVVAIRQALTCGTDVKCFRRGHPVLLRELPSPFGHEFCGVVAAVGEGVSSFRTGQRVVAVNSAPCDACYFCVRGQHNLCESLTLLNGAYAEAITLPARIVAKNTYALPSHVPDEAAAFLEPLAIAVRGIEGSGIQPGDRVAILGLGAIGLLLTRLATLKGAHVTALGRSALKRDLAARFGQAQTVVNLAEHPDPADWVAQTPEGRGFDVVIEAVGQPHTWAQAVDAVRRGGRVNLFGGCASGTTLTLDTRRLHYDELTILSLFHHTPAEVRQALDLLVSGAVDPTPLITDRLPMSRVVEALQRVEAGQAVKIGLTPS